MKCPRCVGVSLALYSVSATAGEAAGICGMFCAILYLLLADGLRNGQSYGKRAVYIAVIDATTGRPCTFRQSLVRNLSLVVLGVIDWVFMAGRKQQRLGDRAAGTIVVSVVS
jgi:uncharacterized RDD family membrane protein YckC